MRVIARPLALGLALAPLVAGAAPPSRTAFGDRPVAPVEAPRAQRTPAPLTPPTFGTWLYVFRAFTDDDARRAALLESEVAALREIGGECVRSLEEGYPRPTGEAWDRLVGEHVARLRDRLGEAAFLSLASYARTTWERFALSPEEGDEAPWRGRRRQEIRFRPLRTAFHGDPDFLVEARATSRLPVYLSATGDCTVRGLSVHVLTAGRCWITAQQPGNGEYDPAPEVVQVLPIRKAGQRITAADLPPVVAFGSGTLFALMTSSSGLPVVISAVGVCASDGATIRLTGVGSCLITGHQPGSSNYMAAPIVEIEVTVVKGEQMIRLPDLGTGEYGPDDIRFVPVATSGLAVTVTTEGPSSFTGQALRVLASGTCRIVAEQPGDENYDPAPKAVATVSVVRPD